MAKAAKKNQTSNVGSSNRKAKNGNGGNGKGAAQLAEKETSAKTDAATTANQPSEEPKEKKRRGRAPTEGEPLKRVLIFLSESDVAALKAEVGDRGMSTRIREILKEYLAKRA